MTVTNIATLGIRVQYQDADKAKGAIDRLAGSAPKATSAVDKLRSAFDRLGTAGQTAAGVLGGLGIANLVSGIVNQVSGLVTSFIDIARESQKLQASLETVTGSVSAAKEAFADIEKFATTTPFTLNQVAEAFIKLKALGLDPSEEALTSYGNTAAAMGKDLMQFIEAVADASTGEFERLKEFGIKSKKEGDNVSFTFQGVTKTIKNSAEEVQKYLRDIGLNQFSGAMKRQMDTIDGAISNLGDAWTTFLRKLGETGIIDGVEAAIRGLTSVIDVLTKNINTVAGVLAGAFTAALVYVSATAIPLVIGGIAALISSLKLLTTWLLRIPLVAVFTLMTIAVQTFVTAVLDAQDETEEMLRRSVTMGQLINAVWASIGEAFSFTIDEISKAWASRLTVMSEMVSGFWEGVKNVFSGDFSFDAFGKALQMEVDSVDWSQIGEKFSAAVDPKQLAPRIKAIQDAVPPAPPRTKPQVPGTASDDAASTPGKKTKPKKKPREREEQVPELTRQIEQMKETIQLDRIRLDNIGKTEGAIQKLTLMQEMENVAGRDKIAWTGELRDSSQRLVDTYVDQQTEIERLNQLYEDGKSLTDDMKNADERRLENLKSLDEMLKRNIISQETYNRKIKEMNDDALEDSIVFEDGVKRAFKSLSDEGKDHALFAEDVVLTGFSSMADGLAEFAATGKLDFKDFANSLIADMARIAARAALLQIFNAAVNAYSGTATTTTTPVATGSNSSQINASFAQGGIMTSKGPVPLKTYANGGIANSPQLALFGEGRKPEAYIPLPDGRTVPVTVSEGSTRRGPQIVNNINTTIQTGNEVDPGKAKEYAKQFNAVTETKWDQKMAAYQRSAQNRKMVG